MAEAPLPGGSEYARIIMARIKTRSLDEEIGLPNDAIIDFCLDMLGFLREKPE